MNDLPIIAYEMPVPLAQEIIDYLSSQPFKQVVNMIAGIQNMTPIRQAPEIEEGGKD